MVPAPPTAPVASQPHGTSRWELAASSRGARDPKLGPRAVSGSAYRWPWCAPGSWQPWEAFQPLTMVEEEEEKSKVGRCCCAELHPWCAPWGHPAPQGEGRRGGCPMAGLSPASSAPHYLLWVQRSPGREGQDPSKREAGGSEAPSLGNPPQGPGANPKPVGKVKDSPVSQGCQGVPVGQGGQ